MGPLGALGQVAEIAAADMHERLVVAALEIDIGGIAEAFIKDPRYRQRPKGSGVGPEEGQPCQQRVFGLMAMIQTNTSTATGGTRMA